MPRATSAYEDGNAGLKSRHSGGNVWLTRSGGDNVGSLPTFDLRPDVLPDEEAIGRTMLDELRGTAAAKQGELNVILLGGRGAQALHRLLGAEAEGGDSRGLIERLNVWTQDALAPLGTNNSLSFVRDFERLLGAEFFRRVKSFNTLRTDASDLASEVADYAGRLAAAGGADIFFLGHGPEPGDASHLAYIKPGAGATVADIAGLIPISGSILEHHIGKFKAGGSHVTPEDEAECRAASHILTLGPAAILDARRVVQSIVDADTAPAKRRTYRRVAETVISDDPTERARQLDANPGLWVRLHPNLRSLVLPNVLS